MSTRGTAARRPVIFSTLWAFIKLHCSTPTSASAAPMEPSPCPRPCSCAPTGPSPRVTSASSTTASWPPRSRIWSVSRLRVVSVALFRRLAVVTAVFAYLQIALGGVVRVSGSGLGCPDWPLCHGRPYPPADPHAIIEYSHRAVGSVTGVLIIATVVLAWVVLRSRRPVVAWLATASLIGVVGEGILGGVVVANELSSWLVVAHLGLAMIILGFLVATAVMATPRAPRVYDPGFRRLAAIAAGATYLLLLTGSTVVASGAEDSCRSWPLCGSGFAPDFSGANAFTMLHRGSVLLIGLLLLFVLLRAR